MGSGLVGRTNARQSSRCELAERSQINWYFSACKRKTHPLTTPVLFSSHKLKDGSRAGSKQISDFTKGFVDAIYAKLLVVEEQDGSGNVVKRERRRSANAAMTACRRAWFVGQRAQETKVPTINPFSRMGLKTRAPGQPVRETPRRSGTNSSHLGWPRTSSDTAQSGRPRC
jgi:hypothetical protein